MSPERWAEDLSARAAKRTRLAEIEAQGTPARSVSAASARSDEQGAWARAWNDPEHPGDPDWDDRGNG
jgi:hypothetical protein